MEINSQWLSDKYNKPSSKTAKILALCDFDAYSNSLNFVFGEAHLDGSISAIYLPKRLDMEYTMYAYNPFSKVLYQASLP